MEFELVSLEHAYTQIYMHNCHASAPSVFFSNAHKSALYTYINTNSYKVTGRKKKRSRCVVRVESGTPLVTCIFNLHSCASLFKRACERSKGKRCISTEMDTHIERGKALIYQC